MYLLKYTKENYEKNIGKLQSIDKAFKSDGSVEIFIDESSENFDELSQDAIILVPTNE